MAALFSVHRSAVVHPQSVQHSDEKDRHSEEDNPGLRRALEKGSADDREYRASQRAPWPPTGPQGTRETSQMRFSWPQNRSRTRRN
jgi:hypothetical protein